MGVWSSPCPISRLRAVVGVGGLRSSCWSLASAWGAVRTAGGIVHQAAIADNVHVSALETNIHSFRGGIGNRTRWSSRKTFTTREAMDNVTRRQNRTTHTPDASDNVHDARRKPMVI